MSKPEEELQHIIINFLIFRGVQPSDLRVVVGQYDMNGHDDKEMAFEIEKIYLHKDYQ